MGWLANRITEWLIIHGATEEEDRDLYEYAALSLLMTVAPLFLAILVGGIMGELATGIFIVLPFMAIRKFSGGYHAKHAGTCLCCSCGLVAACIFLQQKSPIVRNYLSACAQELFWCFYSVRWIRKIKDWTRKKKRDIKIRREALHWQYVSLLWQVSFAGTGDLRCVWQSVCSLH